MEAGGGGGSEEEAERLYRKGLELDPVNGRAVSNLAALLHVREARGGTVHTGGAGEAAALYARAVKLLPASAEVAYNAAVYTLEQGGDAAGGVKMLRRLQARHPDFVPALHYLAKIAIDGHSRDQVRGYRLLKRCLTLAPADAEVQCTYAVFLAYYINDVAMALDVYAKVLQREPRHLSALTGQAALLADACGTNASTGVPDAADVRRVTRLYQQIIEWYPASAEACLGFACLKHHVVGDVAAARALYDRVLALQPDHPIALGQLASLIQRSEPAAAEALYTRALAVRPTDADTESDYAQLLLERHRAREAEHAWLRILKCSCAPQVADSHHWSCRLCHRPTIARLLALRNISLGGEQEAKEEGEEEEEHANAMGKLLEFVCDIPGSCGEGLQALGLWEPSEEVQRLWDNINLAAAADAKPVLDPADYPVT